MISIAVIMTVHNRKELTLSCLSHLFESGFSFNCFFDVYLTDDGCTDGTPEAVKVQFPKVNILKGDGNLYWNRGMHLAWNEAVKKNYDYYLWLNDDIILFDYAISRLIECSKLYNDKSIIVGSACSTTDSNIITWGGNFQKTGLIRDLTKPVPCDLINGNIVLIPKFVYDKVGLNDPYFHHSLGDFDYGLRAKKHNIQSIVAPGIYGQCDIHATIPTWRNPSVSLKKRWYSILKPNEINPFELFFFRKRHYGLIPACLTFVSNFLHVLFPKLWKCQ